MGRQTVVLFRTATTIIVPQFYAVTPTATSLQENIRLKSGLVSFVHDWNNSRSIVLFRPTYTTG